MNQFNVYTHPPTQFQVAESQNWKIKLRNDEAE